MMALFRKMENLIVLIVVALLAVVTLPYDIYAGNGTFQNGNFNFCVSIRFNATTVQLEQIRTAFQNASQVLADATEGQHKFDTITIVNDSGASKSTEYWVNSGSGRAYATQGQYGIRGEYVNLFFDSNFQSSNGADGDAYTIAHEHAHHAYGVLDEYSGPSGNAECAAPPDTATLNFSLMDNYFIRGGRAFGAGYTLNEFCTLGNHDPDKDTWQQKVHGKSAWEVIAAHPKRAATAPASLPVDTPPPAHIVNFKDGFGGLRVMLLLDRSGSMSSEQRLEFAKRGANIFTNFVRVGDSLGVASFSSSPSVNFSLTTIIDDSTRTAARSAINSLLADGSTNIGGGLLTALGQITAQSDRSCNEIIVLLSDGDHNTGTPPADVIPALQAAGVTVLSVGVGSGISISGEATLQDIATKTGGRFFRVSNAFDLVGLFLRLAFESIGNGLLTRAPETIASGEVKETPVLVEVGTKSATFGITFAGSTDVISLSLQTPSGIVITDAEAAINPDIDFIAEPNSLVFQVRNPEAGTWKMVIATGTVTTGVLEILAFAEHEGVQLNVSVKKDTLVFPEAVEIHATPTFEGENVVGASVKGIVVRPDGSKIPIILLDDGLNEHFDAMPGDGIYSARFNNYSEDGTYTFDMTVDNASGTTYGGENLFSFEPSNTHTIPTFTRAASVTAIVSGVPPRTPPTAEAGGPYTGTAGKTIPLDASGSSDSDGTIALYEWDWDNNGTFDESTTSPTITHIFFAGLAGTINLRVTDNDGLTDTDTALVTVTPPIVGNIDIQKAQAILDRRAKKYRFSVSGKLTLGPTSDGTNVLNENVNIIIGGFSQIISSGSFILRRAAPFGGRGSGVRFFQLKNGVPGNITSMKIFQDGTFELTTRILDGVDPTNPLNFSLQIGNDFGEKNVLFQKITPRR